MIKIIRYSKEGFNPQKQTYHIQYFESLGKHPIDSYPEHLRDAIAECNMKKVAFYKAHLDDFQEGLWFFLDGHKNNQALNHLKEKVPCWEAEIDEDVMVYDCNLESVVQVNDSIVEAFGCYIPKRLLGNVKNVHRRKSLNKIGGRK